MRGLIFLAAFFSSLPLIFIGGHSGRSYLLKLPLHGTVRLANGEGKPVDWPNPVRAIFVFYKLRSSFVGKDQFIVQRKDDFWSNGLDRQLTIVVTVQ